MLLKEKPKLPFKCKKFSNKWKSLENIAILECGGRFYKSNKVIVYNKKCKNKWKSKILFCDQNCDFKYKIKVFKYCKNCVISYKICIIVIEKQTKKKYKIRLKL